MGRRRVRFGQEIAEECCFECKDGGEELRVCDYMNCLKSYHPHCVGGDGFPPPGEQFICNWHTCVDCGKNSDYQCLCCPNYSVCCNCLENVEFFKLGKQNKGLCRFCLTLAVSIEKNAADPRAKSNYQDSDISALLFKDYWSVIKDREHLTLVDLQEASGFIDTSLNCTPEVDGEESPDEDHKSDEDYLGDSDDNEETFPSGSTRRPDKMKTPLKRKRSKSKAYVGWGTKALIEFLSSLGKDTKEPLDEDEVVRVVREYIKQKGLFLGDKKKYFECDDELRPLFTRRKVKYNMLHGKLRTHLASNAASEDESLDGSEDDDSPIIKKKPQASLKPKIAERVSERNKRRIASLNQNNINLLYLRRFVVFDLLKHQDTFEQKVVGCFVRVKNNTLSHFYQKSKRSFQLGLVTGIKKSEKRYKIKDTYTDVILCVAGFCGDVQITMLSEENIQEDEFEDLVPLVEKGLLKRTTVAEFEEKVAAVHTDIVNHWIDREIKRLEKAIDLANEKGWRSEMRELMDKKKLLSTPAERQRRLEIPEIIADVEDEKETELKSTADNSILTQNCGEVPRSVTAGNFSQVNRGERRDRTACLVDMEENSKEATQPVADSLDVLKEKSSKGVTECASEPIEVLKEKLPEGATELAVNACNILNEETSKGEDVDQVADSLRVHEEESREVDTPMVARAPAPDAFMEARAPEASMATTGGRKGKAGEALSNGITSDSVLHSLVFKAQDGDKTQAIDIDKDESNHTKHNGGSKIPVPEVINVDSSDDEDDVHGPEREMVHPPRAMNGGNIHREQPESALHAALRAQGAMDGGNTNREQPESAPRAALHALGAMNGGNIHREQPESAPRAALHAQGAMNGGNIHREQPESAPRAALHALGGMNARGDMNWDLEYEAERARDNRVPLFTRLWYYTDPQGITQGPHELIRLWEWKRDGYFDDSFKVWMAGQRKEQAILLTDAFKSVL